MGKSVRPHNLQPNTKPFDVRHVIYLDVETTPVEIAPDTERHDFRLAVVESVHYDQNLNPTDVKTCVAYTPYELAHLLNNFVSKDGKTLVLAHNATYDLAASGLLHRLAELDWKVNIMRAEVGSLILKCGRNHRMFYVLDNLNFLRGSIEELGKIVGLDKLKVDYKNVDTETLITYCKRDVAILRQAFESYLRFLKEHDLGHFGLTISAQALNAFRHRFMHTPIHIHTDLETKRYERLAYSGGFVMPFRIGTWTGKTFVKLDVNSLYPWVMRTCELPYHFRGYLNNPTPDRIRKALKYYAVIADVIIRPKLPCFPRKVKRGTLYPLYPFRTVLTTPEVIEALNQNAILEVFRVAIYDKAILFDRFVDCLYNLRKDFRAKGNRIYDMATKLMLNSLYGKFGARNTKWVERDDLTFASKIYTIDKYADTSTTRALYYINGKAYAFEDDGDAYNTAVFVAAHITAYARMRLWEFIKIAGPEHLYYSDTDSLIVDTEGYENLKEFVSNTELGMLKVEGTATNLTIRGKKDYSFGEQDIHKGIPRNAQYLDDSTVKHQMWPSLLGSLNTPEEKPYTVKTITKHLNRDVWYATVDNTYVNPLMTPTKDDPDPLSPYPLPYSEFAPENPDTPDHDNA